jgi:hypothetical protein
VTEVLNQKRSTVASLLVAAAMAFTPMNAIAADYPPSLEQLVVGQPIITPAPPQKKGVEAVVPKATSNQLPILLGEPVKASAAKLSTKTLTNKSVEAQPVRLTSAVILGGIGSDEKPPLATVSSKKNSEIQIPVDAPTRINITGLKAKATGTATFVDALGRSTSLGTVVVSANGVVSIPALTFAKKDVTYSIKLTIGGKTTTYVIRTRG